MEVNTETPILTESFHWDHHFVTGLEMVDKQHQFLVDLINRLGSLLANNALDVPVLEKVFQELADYTNFHFREEEQFMTRLEVDSRHREKHIEAHRAFVQEITDMSRGASLSNPKTNKHLLKFLSHWLAYHILGQDQNLVRQIRSIESGNSPQQAYEDEERLRDNSTEPLLRALNGLFLQISARNKALLSLNKSLETQVTTRTRELTIANRHLEELASTDMLTGLHNRRHALRRLNRLWLEADTSNLPLVCIMIDADHFKEVNDLYGHDAGDRVLQELAKTLLHGFRSDDVVCRLGGDEFLVICPDTDSTGGFHIANQVLQTVAQLQVPTGDQHWLGSVSIGVAHRTPDMAHYEDLIKMADRGVYVAKEAGRGCVRSITGSA